MYGIDLTEEQRERLFPAVDKHRLWFGSLHERMAALRAALPQCIVEAGHLPGE